MARNVLAYAIGNAASTTLSVAAANSDTSITITSDTNFAAKSGAGMVIIDESQSTEEIAYSTGKTGAVLTIPLANRGLEGGTAQGHAINATVKGILTAAMWNDMIDSLTNVLLASTGALDTTKVVNLTTAQVLTNKDLSSATNTMPSSVATLTGTQTLTNKRITKRVLSAASYTTDTGTSLNCDNYDTFIVTAQAGDLKFNNPGGTPTDGQTLWIAVTGTAARALTYDTQFEASAAVALPTTTVTTNRLDMGFVWIAATSKWRCVASA